MPLVCVQADRKFLVLEWMAIAVWIALVNVSCYICTIQRSHPKLHLIKSHLIPAASWPRSAGQCEVFYATSLQAQIMEALCHPKPYYLDKFCAVIDQNIEYYSCSPTSLI